MRPDDPTPGLDGKLLRRLVSALIEQAEAAEAPAFETCIAGMTLAAYAARATAWTLEEFVDLAQDAWEEGKESL